MALNPGAGAGRGQVALAPGHGLGDWIKLCNTKGRALAGVPMPQRVSVAELGKHNSEDDCWMAINGQVYNVTQYMHYHPGGVLEILRAAGVDGTTLFRKYHAWVNYEAMLEKCLVGYLVPDPAGTTTTTTTTSSSSSSSSGSGSGKTLGSGLVRSSAPAATAVRKPTPSPAPVSSTAGGPAVAVIDTDGDATPPAALATTSAATPAAAAPAPHDPLRPRLDWYQNDAAVVISLYGALAAAVADAAAVDAVLENRGKELRVTWQARAAGAAGSDTRVCVTQPLPLVGCRPKVTREGPKLVVTVAKQLPELPWPALPPPTIEINPATAPAATTTATAAPAPAAVSSTSPLPSSLPPPAVVPASVTVPGSPRTYAPCRVTAVEPLAPAVLLLRLAPPAGQAAWPPVPLGHHVYALATLHGMPLERAYTPLTWAAPDVLASATPTLDLAVKVYPDGAVSSQLGALRVGDAVHVTPTYSGTLVADRDALAPAMLGCVCAGTGVTPMVNIVRARAARKAATALLCCARREEDILFRSELTALAAAAPPGLVLVNHMLSAPPPKGAPAAAADGKPWPRDFSGRVTAHALQLTLPPPGPRTRVLVCGSPRFNEHVAALLASLGYAPAAVTLLQ